MKSKFWLLLLPPLFVLIGIILPKVVSAQTQPSTINPVSWKTEYNKFSSSHFYIRLGNKYFYGIEPVRVSSDAGTQNTTLELGWKENNIEMRMYMYFRKTTNNMWEMYDLRTYDSTGSDWIDYSPKDSLGNTISSLAGQRNYSYERIFKPINNAVDAEIYCKECSFTAFIPKTTPLSPYGYGIDFRIGLPANETITVTTNPATGYGVNALLLSSTYEVVRDQSNFEYLWSLASDGVVFISSMPVPYPNNACAYEILAPCPNINVQIQGRSPGITQVQLSIKRMSDGAIVAFDSFDVKVIDEQTLVKSPTPSQIGTPDPKIERELSELRGEVGRLNIQVESQAEDIGILKRIVDSILGFLKQIFGSQ